MFADLQCPDSAQAYPVVFEAAKVHHVPVLLRDFPLPRHNWSFKAAILAHYFETRSATLGNDYRSYIYQNQTMILDEAGLWTYTQQFADKSHVLLPLEIDPDKTLETKVRADYDLGQRLGLEYTPTILVIGAGGVSSVPFVETLDRGQLNQVLEDMQKKVSYTPLVRRKTAKKKTR